jgi:hypothetical protein
MISVLAGTQDAALEAVSWQPVRMDHDVVVVGYGKVPNTSASHGSGDLLAVVMRVDPSTHRVTEVDSTAATRLVRDWIAQLLIGADASDSPSVLLDHVDSHYLGNAAGSVKQAISDAWRRYAARNIR